MHEIVYTVNQIHNFTDEELEKLAAFSRNAYKPFENMSVRIDAAYIHVAGLRRLAGDNGYILRAEFDGKLVAFCLYGICKIEEESRYIDAKLMAVCADYQANGGESELIRHLCDIARENCCDYIETIICCKARELLTRYKKIGLKKCAYTHLDNTDFYSVIMRKFISYRFSEVSLRAFRRWCSWWKTHLMWRESGQIGAVKRILMHLRGRSETENVKGIRLKMEHVQQLAFNLAEEFASFCEKYQLHYMLCYGTLIGAIRHKGMVPWDDDMDMAMPLPDYEKFIRLFEVNNANPNIEIVYGTKKGVGINYVMLVDKRTVAIVNTRDREHTRPLAIDIHPVFPLSDDDNEALSQINVMVDVAKALQRRHRVAKGCIWEKIERLLFNGIVIERLLNKANKVFYRHAWGSTNRLRILSVQEREMLAFPVNCFDTCIDWPFEFRTFKIPATYHENLTENYGNYMEPPPEKKRRPFHANNVWISPEPLPQRTLLTDASMYSYPAPTKGGGGGYGVRIKIFAWLPLLTVLNQKQAKVCYFLGFIPLYSLHSAGTKSIFLLFGFIPLVSWKTRY